ncbi:V-type proton ATPase 16 kDa proteolipid subunit-like [Hevea brasiliensis]|uniref:V-type proton ATPase 16 kDa proteolipid subunit-like n=1 Tax=Hevea brasiliensis TaxID=3981 RepID=UPI0025D9FFBF|nr:V-type proton ATPase 16 kDa proteolipid subunit-like [Hevea brasiliensis]
MSSSFNSNDITLFFCFFDNYVILVFSCMGATYGAIKSGVGVANIGVMRPKLVMKLIVLVVMACVLGIYGLIIVVIISNRINLEAKSYYLFDEYANFSSHLACGLSRLFAGMVIGIIGDVSVIANA